MMFRQRSTKIYLQKGAVLILVLWVIALLSMLAGYFTLETALQRNLGFDKWNMLRSRIAITSILNVITPHIKKFPIEGETEEDSQQQEEDFIVPDGREYRIKMNGQEITFSIEDERGKVDLNRASEDLLRRLLIGLLGQDRGDELCDSILDWRDNDEDERSHGAEKDYYESLDMPYEPANGNFVLLEQLALIKGMNPELYWGPLQWKNDDDENATTSWEGGLQDIFTIYGKNDKLLSQSAPLPVMDILEEEDFRDMTGLGTMRFKTCMYQACYQIFFENHGGIGSIFRLVHWQQIPRFGQENNR